MKTFVNRNTQYPGRVKLTKVSEDPTGTIYDSTPAEGTVYNAGTPLDAETFNDAFDELKNADKLYRHRIRLTGGGSVNTGGATPVGAIEIYTRTETALTTASAVASAMGVTSGSTDVPACGCAYSGNNTVTITGAKVSASGITLYGMYFGYASGNGAIQRVSVSVTSVTDAVTEIK